jgi:hypothetical protein
MSVSFSDEQVQETHVLLCKTTDGVVEKRFGPGTDSVFVS